jgi:divalent metal cation (Fe/Co/Zn/Cd) transporter
VGILFVAMALESFSFRTAMVEARAIKGSASWWGFIRHSRNPELPVVLLEDLGALLGLVFALAGVGLAVLTGNSRFDAMGSVAIGILLGVIAVTLSLEMRSLLLGESASRPDRERIRQAILSGERVRTIIHLRTQHLAPDELLIGAKVEFDGRLGVEQLTAAIDAVEDAIRDAIAHRAIIYIEPDFYDASRDRRLPGAQSTPGDDDE